MLARASSRIVSAVARRAASTCSHAPPTVVADARALLHRPSGSPPPVVGWSGMSKSVSLLRLSLDGTPAAPPDRPPTPPPIKSATTPLEIVMPGGLTGEPAIPGALPPAVLALSRPALHRPYLGDAVRGIGGRRRDDPSRRQEGVAHLPAQRPEAKAQAWLHASELLQAGKEHAGAAPGEGAMAARRDLKCCVTVAWSCPDTKISSTYHGAA